MEWGWCSGPNCVGWKKGVAAFEQALQTFIEHTGVDNTFSDIHIAAPLQDSWNMVDVDGDGDLDFVYLPSGRRPVPATGEYKYFKQLKDGKLAQRDGSANPLQAAPTSLLSYFEWIFWKPEPQAFGMNHVVADVDGDGDVDIVHADHRGFMYAEQRNGTFTVLNGLDNPFHLGLEVAISVCCAFFDFPFSFSMVIVGLKSWLKLFQSAQVFRTISSIQASTVGP